MDYRDIYNDWLSNPYFDDDTKAELEAIKSDEKEVEDRFYKELEFGTAGLRGVIGAGTNRMKSWSAAGSFRLPDIMDSFIRLTTNRFPFRIPRNH